MTDMIYIYHNNQQDGPYPPDQLRDMMAQGAVTPDTLAWQEGMESWAPLNTIVASAEWQSSAAPPPPPGAFATAQPRDAAPPGDAQGPKGVGGWLLFFCVQLTILGPLMTLVQTAGTLAQSRHLFAEYPSFTTAIMFETIGIIAILTYAFIVGLRIWSGSPKGRDLARQFLLVRLFGIMAIKFIAVIIIGDTMGSNVAYNLGYVLGASIFPDIIMFLVWWSYFNVSKRVRNTYGPG